MGESSLTAYDICSVFLNLFLSQLYTSLVIGLGQEFEQFFKIKIKILFISDKSNFVIKT